MKKLSETIKGTIISTSLGCQTGTGIAGLAITLIDSPPEGWLLRHLSLAAASLTAYGVAHLCEKAALKKAEQEKEIS